MSAHQIDDHTAAIVHPVGDDQTGPWLRVELDDNETLISVRGNQFYRLGDPLGDVVPAHVIEDMMLAKWCPVAQKWEV